MLSSTLRLAAPMHRREMLGWPVLFSLALHLALLLSLLIIAPVQPPTTASDPLSVDVVAEQAPAAAAPEPPAPAEVAAAPVAPPPVQQAETPPPPPEPAPDPPPPPPVEQVEQVEQAELPPPAPAPPPVPEPPPPPHVAQARPLPVPPQRVTARPASARAPVNPAGTPARATDGQDAASRASNGAAWMGKLKQWWDQHSFYPKEASQTNEGGNVRVHILIAADGQVTSVEMVQGSGSSVLDAAAVAVFRGAHLPPFPPGTPAQPADVVVTLHYRPAEGGG